MVKKNKKKTVASTRKSPGDSGAELKKIKKNQKSKILGKLLKTAKSKTPVFITVSEPKTAEEKKQERAEKDSIKAAAKLLAAAEEAKAQEKKEAEAAAAATIQGNIIQKEKKRKPFSPIVMQRIKGILLLLIGAFALLFIGWFLFGKLFRAAYLAEVLPAKSTIGIFEVNIDGGSDKVKKFLSELQKYPVYSSENLINLVNYALPVDYGKEIAPWIGRRMGVGIVGFGNAGVLNPVFLIETKDQNKTIDFLKSRQVTAEGGSDLITDEYKGYKIFSYKVSSGIAATFIGNYLTITENKDILFALLDELASTGKLIDTPEFQKVANNLPVGALAFGYLDTVKLLETLAHNSKYMAAHGQDLTVLKPFLKIFKAGGLVMNPDKNKLVFQTYALVDKEQLAAGLLSFDQKYQGKLLPMADTDSVLLMGGVSLSNEINRYEKLFSAGTKTSSLIFQGLLEAQKERYLGKNISLTNDLYPLLDGEYMLEITGSFEKPSILVALEINDLNRDLPRLEKLVSAFVTKSGIFKPEIRNITLPDGTTGQEVVGSSQQIQRFDEQYESIAISSLKLGETGITVSYGVTSNTILFSTSLPTLKNAIDRAEGKNPNTFEKTGFYSKVISPALRNADELINMKFGAVSAATGLSDNPILKSYLLPFGNLAITKNYFDDGISTIYLLEII